VNTSPFRRTLRYLIQWDTASKRFPFRVLTVSGECLAYFRTASDAREFCS
jgi:hypothetical protein